MILFHIISYKQSTVSIYFNANYFGTLPNLVNLVFLRSGKSALIPSDFLFKQFPCSLQIIGSIFSLLNNSFKSWIICSFWSKQLKNDDKYDLPCSLFLLFSNLLILCSFLSKQC